MRKQMTHQSAFYFIAIAMATLFMVACTESPVSEPEQDEASLRFDQESIEVDPLGGEYSVYYTLTNGIANINPVPQVNVSWIKDLRADDQMIYFTVEPNTTASMRSTKIDLKYPGIEIPILLTVNQPIPAEAMFSIDVTNLSTTGCATIIVPKEPEMYYIAFGASVSYLRDEGIETAEQLFMDDYTYFKSLIEQYDNVNFGQFLIYNRYAHQGTSEPIFSGLSLNESFVIYVYGIEFTEDTSDYSLATPIYHVIVTPTSDDMPEVKFTMTYDIDGPEVTHHVTPIDYDGAYYYEYFPEGNQYFYPEEQEITEAYVASVISDWNMFADIYLNFGYSAEQFMAMACRKGTFTKSETLIANTRYMAQAYAIENVDGKPLVVSKPQITYFTTGDVNASDMTIDINIENVYARVADVTITPSSDDESYCVFLSPTSIIDDQSDIIDGILANNKVSPIVGTYTEHLNSLSPETEYSILAFGYHGGKATTELFRLDFTTTAAGTCENSVQTINIGAPYSAAELAEIDPDTYGTVAMYDEYGYYLMWAELIPEKPTQDIFFHHYELVDIQELGTSGIINDLLRYPSRPIQTLSWRNDVQFIMCGIVMDYKGDVSELWMGNPFSFNLANKRPREEFLEKIHSYDNYSRAMSTKRASLVIKADDDTAPLRSKAEALKSKSKTETGKRLTIKVL